MYYLHNLNPEVVLMINFPIVPSITRSFIHNYPRVYIYSTNLLICN